MPRQDQTGAEDDQGDAFVDEYAQRVGHYALKDGAPLLDSGEDASKAGVGEYDTGRGFGNVGRGRDGDTHLRLSQRRGVIGAVAAHADCMSLALKCFDEAEFLLREDSRVNSEIVRADALGKLPRRTYRAVHADGTRDG